MKGFNRMQFIKDAISKDTTRPNLCDAYYDADNMRVIACDGCRLHAWTLEEAEAEHFGLHEKSGYVKILPKEGIIVFTPKDMQFPNVAKITPERKPSWRVAFTDNKGKYLESVFALATGTVVNSEYLGALFGESWQLSMTTDDKALRFDCGALMAVIMPMTKKECMDAVMEKIEEAKA